MAVGFDVEYWSVGSGTGCYGRFVVVEVVAEAA